MEAVMVRHLVPVNEVAKRTAASAVKIRRLIKGGEIRIVRIGSRVMVPSDELDRILIEGVGSPRKQAARRRRAS
jgi:excisionase family DNA binding protein